VQFRISLACSSTYFTVDTGTSMKRKRHKIMILFVDFASRQNKTRSTLRKKKEARSIRTLGSPEIFFTNNTRPLVISFHYMMSITCKIFVPCSGVAEETVNAFQRLSGLRGLILLRDIYYGWTLCLLGSAVSDALAVERDKWIASTVSTVEIMTINSFESCHGECNVCDEHINCFGSTV